MKVAYFDCFAGAAGDMIVGALLDAGLSLETLRAELAKLELPGVSVSAERVRRGGLTGTKFTVQPGQTAPPRRNLSDILALLEASALPERPRRQAQAIFQRLGEAEAKVHGVDVQEVHFHEVGAVDSIVDIVAATVGLERLGVEGVLCSPLPTGSGTVQTAHGELPLPAPATAELLRRWEIVPGPEGARGELTTPTAAAVLTTLAERAGAAPEMTLEAVGYGAGAREAGPVPNLLRVLIGSCRQPGRIDTVVELSANLDDCTGEVIGAALEKLLAAGCLDAWATPVYMKKSRPGWMLSALCRFDDADRAEEILFSETTTLGVRRRTCRRSKLARRHETVQTPYGPVRVKLGLRDGRALTAAAEFADARVAAEAHGVPLKEVLAAALEAWRKTAG